MYSIRIQAKRPGIHILGVHLDPGPRTLDLSVGQLVDVQRAVDAGDIEAYGMPTDAMTLSRAHTHHAVHNPKANKEKQNA